MSPGRRPSSSTDAGITAPTTLKRCPPQCDPLARAPRSGGAALRPRAYSPAHRAESLRRSAAGLEAGKPAFAVPRRLAMRHPRVRLRRVGRLLFDAGAVLERSRIDGVAAPI